MINISLLGNPVVSHNGKPLRLRDRKGMALIAYLTLEGRSNRDKLRVEDRGFSEPNIVSK
jgi:DNA-binding SARP family transcriptional activator